MVKVGELVKHISASVIVSVWSADEGKVLYSGERKYFMKDELADRYVKNWYFIQNHLMIVLADINTQQKKD